jgi:hypothetical protein
VRFKTRRYLPKSNEELQEGSQNCGGLLHGEPANSAAFLHHEGVNLGNPEVAKNLWAMVIAKKTEKMTSHDRVPKNGCRR